MRMSAARFRVCSGRPGGPCLQDKVELLQRLPAAAPGADRRGQRESLSRSPGAAEVPSGAPPPPPAAARAPGTAAPGPRQRLGPPRSAGAPGLWGEHRRPARASPPPPPPSARAAAQAPPPRPAPPRAGDALPAPSLPRGPAAPPGPQQLDKGVWTGAQGPVPCVPPGCPFKRDFGDSCSFRPNSSPLYPAETIF
ncbi:unnamed protein product [Nyctereutes procyonoides]|uniref:(raccoon dog) hypothetical protein n=1 Tax=Nyctereutes procyonoides TaxID=34880 RepID=A0A811YX06_NYCPR|nr:unnamed protein product [Nyctereutes procyonoides]